MASNDNMTKTMVSMFSVIIMMAVLAAVVTGIPTPPPPPPPVKYICPIDGLEFNSLAELEAHFAEAHPTTPIDIIWD